eukprot:3503735-Prymnesium_polylepis.1
MGFSDVQIIGLRSDRVKWASSIAATIRPCCAWPLGAVRLAERPSWRTALPCNAQCAGSSEDVCPSATAACASARTYPSASVSNV